MRHRVKTKLFNRDTKQRKAMFKSLLVNLFQHGAIETTEEKAKQLRRLADKLIHRALPQTVNARRLLEGFFGSKQVVNHLVDRIAPLMSNRDSGFTRIVKLGRRRGDDASMVKIELVKEATENAAESTVETVVATAQSRPTAAKAAKARTTAGKKAPAQKKESQKA